MGKPEKQQQSQERPVSLESNPKPMIGPQGFDQWWAAFSSKNPQYKKFKNILAIHMKERGFWQRQAWADGARDFGLQA